LTIAGPWGTTFSFPAGRLPITLGSDRALSAVQSVYPRVRLDVPIIIQKLGIAAGATTTSTVIDKTMIQDWATRFQTLFDEYCLVGADIEIRLSNFVSAQGVILFYLEEKSSAAATLASAMASPHLDVLVSATESPSRYRIKWVAQDLTDLAWSDTSTTVTPVYLKQFASNAGTGTGAATTFDVIISGTLAFEFRGYR
jgi:hypothetical protein